MPIDARQVLIDYLLMKAEQSDWHAVSDAANDLRVLEAQRLKVWQAWRNDGKARCQARSVIDPSMQCTGPLGHESWHAFEMS